MADMKGKSTTKTARASEIAALAASVSALFAGKKAEKSAPASKEAPVHGYDCIPAGALNAVDGHGATSTQGIPANAVNLEDAKDLHYVGGLPMGAFSDDPTGVVSETAARPATPRTKHR